jgi:thymidylate synthase (FAD)
MVELLEVFGNDTMCCNAARVSYNKEASNYTDEQNAKLIKYLVEHKHCYDGETEVLTSKGFIKWQDIIGNELFATVNPVTRIFNNFEKCSEFIKKDIDENVVVFKTQGVNLKVTENHSLYCSFNSTQEKRKTPNYQLAVGGLLFPDGKKVYQKPMRMIKSAINDKTGGNPQQFSLYGFFIGDGNCTIESKNRISFHLKKERKIKYLKEIANNLQLEIRNLTNDTYSIIKDNIGGDFRRMFYNSDNNKTFPIDFFNMTKDEYVKFKEGLINSDGHINKNETSYSTNSLELSNRIQELGCINNDSISINNKSNGMFSLNFHNERKSSPRLNDSKSNKYILEHHKGKVYCATVSTGLLIVRRNNKVVLCGNTSVFRHPQLQFRITCPIYVARQLEKHQVGMSLNSISGRYVDFSDSYTTIKEWRKQSKSSKQGSEGLIEQQDIASMIEQEVIENCKQAYNSLLELGVSKEQARGVLPLSLNTTFIWTGSFLAFIHLFNLRLKKDAQQETRELVQKILECIKTIEGNPFKFTIEAFGL